MLRWLCDKVVLDPSRDPIEVDDKERIPLEFEFGQFEIWEGRSIVEEASDSTGASSTGASSTDTGGTGSSGTGSSGTGKGSAQLPEPELPEPELLVLKFPGTGGRAENATTHPAEAWPEFNSVVWTVNPPGYGQSPGRASLRNTAAVARTSIHAMRERYGNKPMILIGNSLGGLSVLYLAARHEVNGLVIRNPPPLAELIRGEYPWWKTAFVSTLVSSVVPPKLSTINNARRCSTRAVFIMSEYDRVVPPRYQQQIHDAYAHDMKLLTLAGADHADPMPEEVIEDYRDAIRWLM